MLLFGDRIDLKQKIGAGIVFIGIIIDVTSKRKNNKIENSENIEIELEFKNNESQSLLNNQSDDEDQNQDTNYEHEIFNINHRKSYI